MMKARRLFAPSTFVSLLAATCVASAGCGLTEPAKPVATTVTIAPAGAATLPSGASLQLVATVKDQNGSVMTGQTVAYTSATPAVASITNAGLVLGALVGSAAITASVGTKSSDPLVVTVVAGAARNFTKQTDLAVGIVAGSTASISARASDAAGNPVSGVGVTFTVATGGGTTTPTTTFTDAGGLATSAFRVGSLVGSNLVTASAVGLTGSPLMYSTTTIAGPAAQVIKIGSDAIGLVPGATFNDSLRVQVVDANGNPRSGTIVAFAVTAGAGSIQPATVTTDSAGRAAARFVTGTSAGANVANATVSGLAPVTFSTTTTNMVGGLAGTVLEVVVSGSTVSTRSSSGATITFMNSNGATTASVTTSSTGAYTVTGLPIGSYTVRAAKSGFTNADYLSAIVSANSVNGIGTLTLVPVSTATGGISGAVRDARDATGLSNATITLRSGQNNTTGATLATTTSLSTGGYTFSGLMAGVYTVTATLPGYVASSVFGISVGGFNVPNQDVILSPTSSNIGEVRIVLAWGAEPSDLDSHLTGPTTSEARFHVYYWNEGSLTSSPFAQLDVDDVSSYGPETITIAQQLPGVYRYSVHDYSNAGLTSSFALSQSSATVSVYRGNSLIARFFVPAGSGTLWTVFELNGGVITAINTMTDQDNSDAVAMRAVTGRSPSDADVIRSSVRKRR